MATLALGAVGTLIGGPIGGAIGAIAGRQIDSSLIGGNGREGPRLKDLSITSSSYGSSIPQHFGRVRAGGTIIWATNLQEDQETSGGKGKPRTTSFSYSSSFAVALSSRPILSVGRIWADGNLLRGAAGDLKVGGTLRIYDGHGDQPVDPLIASAEGAFAPAFRRRAYVVFEDLQLEDFGNRIPALSFEVFADVDDLDIATLIDPEAGEPSGEVKLAGLAGFTHESGAISGVVETIDALYPLSIDARHRALRLQSQTTGNQDAIVLPDAVARPGRDGFDASTGQSLAREPSVNGALAGMRYYDLERDYQPGVQRPAGRAGLAQQRMIEFPGVLTPDDARSLIDHASLRTRRMREVLNWRMAELDPTLSVGSLVTAPGIAGQWLVETWEWTENGIELELERAAPQMPHGASGDSGTPALPTDLSFVPTELRVFELPWDGTGPSNDHHIFVAAGAVAESWGGASLYIDNQGPMTPIGSTDRAQATMGTLVAPLVNSPAVVFERFSSMEVELLSPSMGFVSASLDGIANGQNRLMVGEEILQFASAEQVSATRWVLHGLLRGRGGSERAAQLGHPATERVTLLNSKLTPLKSQSLSFTSGTTVSAIGRGDDDPVQASIANLGTSLRPLTPVHPQSSTTTNGGLSTCWVRRARGAWIWRDSVDAPLHEEAELYQIGIGDVSTPDVMWQTTEPEHFVPLDLLSAHSGKSLWVKQLGQASTSHPLLLATLA